MKTEFRLVAGACAALVLATFLVSLVPSEASSEIFRQFNLGFEENVAAWFSGSLLALIALHALDGRTLHMNAAPNTARAWTMIAGILLFLSADEVGSIHERISGLSKVVGLGAWGLLLPIGLVLALLLVWALRLLWGAGGQHRRQAWLVFLGFVLLGSVAMQEFLEHTLNWNTVFVQALRLTIEEGSELLGMLVLLRVALGNTAALLEGHGSAKGSVFSLLQTHQRHLVLLLLGLGHLMALLAVSLQDKFGRPEAWVAAMAFLAAAALVLRRMLEESGDWTTPWQGILLLLLSCTCVAIGPGGIVETPLIVTTSRAILLVVLTVALFGLCMLSQPLNVSLSRLVGPAGVSVLLLLFSEYRLVAVLLTIWLGAAVYREIALMQAPTGQPDARYAR